MFPVKKKINNNDLNDEKFETVLSDFIKNEFIQIFNYRGKISTQLKIYEKCYNSNKNKFDWFIFFDIDEFIHLNNYNGIKDFLNEKKFKDCKLIYFNCVRHTDNDLLYYDNRSLSERFPTILWNSKMYTLKTIMRGKNKNNVRFHTTHWLNRGLKGGCNVFGEVVFPTKKVKLGNNINIRNLNNIILIIIASNQLKNILIRLIRVMEFLDIIIE